MKSFIVFFALFLVVAAVERCSPDNCKPSAKQCEKVVSPKIATCSGKGEVCCYIVAEEYRTSCRHHGGECTESGCHETLAVKKQLDCAAGETCCVLV